MYQKKPEFGSKWYRGIITSGEEKTATSLPPLEDFTMAAPGTRAA